MYYILSFAEIEDVRTSLISRSMQTHCVMRAMESLVRALQSIERHRFRFA